VRRTCTFCSNDAIVSIPVRNLKLCREHFIQFFETEVENVVEKFQMLKNVRRLLVAVSGGKDSVAMLYTMYKIAKSRNVELIGVTIDLGIEGYSDKCVEIARKHFEKLGIDYRIIKLEDYNFTIDIVKKYEHILRRPVCSVCGIVKRYILNKIALELRCDAITTGHNLVDIAQYIFANIMSGDLRSLAKLKPVIKGEEGILVTKIRPLFFMHEKYTELYVNLLGLDYVREKCPYSMRGSVSHKTPLQEYLRIMLLELDHRYPGTLYNTVRNFIKNVLPVIEKGVTSVKEVATCSICGMPTSSVDKICAFCKVRLTLVKIASSTSR